MFGATCVSNAPVSSDGCAAFSWNWDAVFTRWTGSIEVPDGDPKRAQVKVTIDASSIDTGVADRDNHLRSPDFLDVQISEIGCFDFAEGVAVLCEPEFQRAEIMIQPSVGLYASGPLKVAAAVVNLQMPPGTYVLTYNGFLPDIGTYLSFVMNMFIAFGVTFQVPVVVIILVRMGVVTVAKLKEVRPYVIVGAFVVAAAAALSLACAASVAFWRGSSLDAFFPRATAHGEVRPEADGFFDPSRGVRIAQSGEMKRENPVPSTSVEKISSALYSGRAAAVWTTNSTFVIAFSTSPLSRMSPRMKVTLSITSA